jgi:hypothetical protein
MSPAGGISDPVVVVSNGPGVADLLESAPAAHREEVALQLGLPPTASAQEIRATLCDRERIATIVGALSPRARDLAARAAFLDHGVVEQGWNGHSSSHAAELERHGIAFAFRGQYLVAHWVPPDLRPLLAAALAAPYADCLVASGPARWLAAPLQLAHDVASLWAYLARSPVRLKTDGIVYQRDVPKLFDALPPFELHRPQDVMEGPRLTFVLGLLRDERLVRVRLDDRPGADIRRELVASGDPSALLSAEPEALRARLVAHVGHRALMGAPAVALSGALEPGSAVTLESFGAALRAMCDDSAVDVPESTDYGLGIGGLHFAWLAGEVVIGLNENGLPVAVRAEPAAIPENRDRRVVCQPNFELVALAPPTPAERLVLALTCEPVPGQAHVFRLTRASVQAGHRSGALEGGVVAALERLVGELPQNVARSVTQWCSAMRRPLRLRTAMLIDTGDCATADALLAGELGPHVVERLGPSQLAISAANLKAVEAALRREGHSLEPGVERVSGRFEDRQPARGEAELEWEPLTANDAPEGRWISTLERAGAKRRATPVAVPSLRVVHEEEGEDEYEDEDEDEEPIEVILEAIERGSDVFIVYAGAGGMTEHQMTPYQVDGAAVRAHCHTRGGDRSFWLGSIRDAVPVE